MSINEKKYYYLSYISVFSVQLFSGISYLYLQRLGYSFIEINLYLSIFWMVCTILELPSGVLVDTIGPKRVLFISYFVRFIGLFFLVNGNYFFIICLSSVLTALAESLSSGTLDSWIANVLESQEKNTSMRGIISKNRIFSPIIGMISGYLGANILANIDIRLPFIVSAMLYLFLSINVLLLFGKEKSNKINLKNSRFKISKSFSNYIKTLKKLINIVSTDSNFWITIFLFILPIINDVGPSNQWQLMMNRGQKDIVTGKYVVLISISAILANLIIVKFGNNKILNNKYIIPILILLDLICVIAIPLNIYKFVLFYIHVFLFCILSTLIISYIHDKLVVDNSLRNSIVSLYYTIEAVVTSIVLIINGILSELLEVEEVWALFSIIVFFIGIILLFLKRRKKNYV